MTHVPLQDTKDRCKSIPRLGALVAKLKPRTTALLIVSAPPATPEIAVAPPTSPDPSRLLPTVPPRKSSLASSTGSSEGPSMTSSSSVEFQVLPIAPASFERRRPSLPPLAPAFRFPPPPSVSPDLFDDAAVGVMLVGSPPGPPGSLRIRKSSLGSMSGVNLGRRSYSSFEKIQPRAEEEIGGIYNWSEEEAARANAEYVRFLAQKGVKIRV
ncbi:hypothetical protein BC830DRAFT_1126590 [Chytriomyces sp. MP71]|nr:hypothetical protein BC830DRAFT_1126590 [Chytriomyces sp. MP71]